MYKTTRELLSELSPSELAILERRARELARQNIDTGAYEDHVSVLTFLLAGELYAVPVALVREVRPLKQLTRVPFAPPFVIGVINLRGNILSLIDIRKFLGTAGQELTDLHTTIVVEAAGLEVGILARRVHEVTLLSLTSLTPPPATVNSATLEFIEGVAENGIILLNLERILGDPRMIVNEGNN